MLDALVRRVGEFFSTLSAQEVETFGFGLLDCPQCGRPLQRGWVVAKEGLRFIPGKWNAPPTAWQSGEAGIPLRSMLRLGHLLSYVGHTFLAASRCPACRLIVMKHE